VAHDTFPRSLSRPEIARISNARGCVERGDNRIRQDGISGLACLLRTQKKVIRERLERVSKAEALVTTAGSVDKWWSGLSFEDRAQWADLKDSLMKSTRVWEKYVPEHGGLQESVQAPPAAPAGPGGSR
jgi:hypothetical protein